MPQPALPATITTWRFQNRRHRRHSPRSPLDDLHAFDRADAVPADEGEVMRKAVLERESDQILCATQRVPRGTPAASTSSSGTSRSEKPGISPVANVGDADANAAGICDAERELDGDVDSERDGRGERDGGAPPSPPDIND